jgi:ABC-type nitrate/sulfonate/bicarbonate transport system substrate-binding protein
MRELKIIYRSNSHAPFWIVAEKAGIWEKNGLQVNTSPQLAREKAVDALKNGRVDLISGNHHNLYVRIAKNHEDFIQLAQLGNLWTENRMIVADSIREVQDLRGKKVAIDQMNSHAGLNVWLFLRQEGLDPEKGEVKLVEGGPSTEKHWKGVLAGEYDATFVGRPHDLRAVGAGARVIPVRAMPMIRGVTLTTRIAFVRDNEDDVRRLIRGVVETVHFFLTQEERTKDIFAQASVLELQNGEEVSALYDDWTRFLDPKPYPTLEAINNVFALAVLRNPEIGAFNPLILWDTHYVRELDDSGFIDKLYSR